MQTKKQLDSYTSLRDDVATPTKALGKRPSMPRDFGLVSELGARQMDDAQGERPTRMNR